MVKNKSKECFIYTDGSYSNIYKSSGFGVYCGTHIDLCLCGPGYNLPNNQRAEFFAIERALGKVVSLQGAVKRVTICTDSLAAILRIREIQQSNVEPWKGSGLRSIRHLLHLCDRFNIRVRLQKVPAHKGIVGNEIADRLAYRAMDESFSSSNSPEEFENYLRDLSVKFQVSFPPSNVTSADLAPKPSAATPSVELGATVPIYNAVPRIELPVSNTEPMLATPGIVPIIPCTQPESGSEAEPLNPSGYDPSKYSFWRLFFEASKRGLLRLFKGLLTALRC